MINVIILEDEDLAAEKLLSCLRRFEQNSEYSFKITRYDNAVKLLEEYKADADIIFVDIQLPMINGMNAAHMIRKQDADVVIVFVTNLAQYAIEGYEVDAMDFVLKPVSYSTLALKLERLCKIVEHKKLKKDASKTIVFNTKNNIMRVSIDDILYIEVHNHNLLVHLKEETLTLRGTISSMYDKLKDYYFALCNSCYLVNLAYVKSIDSDEVVLNGTDDRLKISQPKRKAFIQEVAKYFGGSI